ncbi:MAG: hypothetical protein MZV70_66825 [Desulfobacterales bacterium]|nr:hypothetical protein [Desulfobacterales bacterium]
MHLTLKFLGRDRRRAAARRVQGVIGRRRPYAMRLLPPSRRHGRIPRRSGSPRPLGRGRRRARAGRLPGRPRRGARTPTDLNARNGLSSPT